jgi:hypothetical protein
MLKICLLEQNAMKLKMSNKRKMSMGQLCSIGKRPDVMQIVPPRHVMRSPVLHEGDAPELGGKSSGFADRTWWCARIQ